MPHFYGQLPKIGHPQACKLAHPEIIQSLPSCLTFIKICIYGQLENQAVSPCPPTVLMYEGMYLKGGARNIYKILLNEKWYCDINI